MEITDIQRFLSYYERIRQRTMRVVACIPPEKIDWTYQEGKFSFGDLLRHIAALERYMFAENFRGKPSCYPGHGPELARTHAEVVDFMQEMHTETVAIIGGLQNGALQSKCTTPGGGAIAIWKWMRAMIEHEVHHRAQIYTYLAMLGIETPPLYGLTEEEVFERSGP